MMWKIMKKGARETNTKEKKGEIFVSIFAKLINGNAVKAFMQKFIEIAWKMKTWPPPPLLLMWSIRMSLLFWKQNFYINYIISHQLLS